MLKAHAIPTAPTPMMLTLLPEEVTGGATSTKRESLVVAIFLKKNTQMSLQFIRTSKGGGFGFKMTDASIFKVQEEGHIKDVPPGWRGGYPQVASF